MIFVEIKIFVQHTNSLKKISKYGILKRNKLITKKATIMTTKQMLFSALILGATANIMVGIEKKYELLEKNFARLYPCEYSQIKLIQLINRDQDLLRKILDKIYPCETTMIKLTELSQQNDVRHEYIDKDLSLAK